MAQETTDSRVPDSETDVYTAEVDIRVSGADARVGTDEPSNASGAILVRGPVPLYHQVYNALRRETDTGRQRPGDRLPTERELGKFYGCSLATVRRALDELVREGQIYRIRERGTFVSESPAERQLAKPTSFTTKMAVRGLEPRTVVLAQRVTESMPSTADRLDTASGLPVYSIKRSRIVGDELLFPEYVFLPEYLFPGLLSLDLGSSSPYTRLSQRFGVDLASGYQTIQPALPSAREVMLFKWGCSEPIPLIRLTLHNADGRLIEYCHIVVKGSRAKHHINVAKSRGV